MTVEIPLATVADAWINDFARVAGTGPLEGATLLGERAVLAGLRVPCGRRSAGGMCFMLRSVTGDVALNLARADDRQLLPALFESDTLDVWNETALAAAVAAADAEALVLRGRTMGLAIAAEQERAPHVRPCVTVATGAPAPPRARPPRVLDLSALWAGPLASHLLLLAGAEVVKVESRQRPDAMRHGEPAFFALLNQAKRSVVLDFACAADRRALLALVRSCDIVITAARPRALAQLGIDASALVGATPGLVWISITAHGIDGEAAGWVGFGDDCGVAGGLSAALRVVSGRGGFVGDAIADPLTGIAAARAAWNAWRAGRAQHIVLAMSAVAAQALDEARAADPAGLNRSLSAWRAAEGQAFPAAPRRAASPPAPWGADTLQCLAELSPC